ncbi:MAG: SDR family oxidoreductase [Betaproteobacteria bacterium]
MRILILGGTGMLGHKLWQLLGARFADCQVTVRGRRADYARFPLFHDPRVIAEVDVADFAALRRILERAAPAVIVNCIGVTKRREPAGNPAASILLNALLPHRLAAWGAAHGARVINFGTDCVFDGRRGNYTELDRTDAEDLYGRTKALGEIAGANALTLRSSFIGRELAGGTELLEWLLGQQGKTIKGYQHALYSGVSTIHLATVVGDIIEKFPQLAGLYHVAAAVISKYDLLMLARAAYKLDVKIEPDDKVIIKRNLDCTRFRLATGYNAPAWPAMMAELAADPTPYSDWRK